MIWVETGGVEGKLPEREPEDRKTEVGMDAQGTENKREMKDERETRRGRRNHSDEDGGWEVTCVFLFQSLSNILSNLGHMTTMIEASKH